MAFLDFMKSKQAEPAPRPQTISVSNLPFEAYRGKKPYIFISYAHADSTGVFPIIKEFHDLGYNVWYDEGIEPGIAWPEEICKALEGCGLFVVFITPRSVKSDNVDNEIYVALSKKKPFIAIHLEPTVLSPGQELQFGKRQAILRYDMDAATFRRKYAYSFEATEVKIGSPRPIPASESSSANEPPKEASPSSSSHVKPITPAPFRSAPACELKSGEELELSGETPFKRLRTLSVDKVTKEAAMYSPTVEADITIVKKNGETVIDRLNSAYTFYALNSIDIIKPAISTISKIVFDYAGV